ncbi:MAG: sugar phosphate isomerase/epimerase family protein, partial [Planctomycetia bacterium]|nr:sugar phosphate isomerase/epimerase family protein [Planctomycetia bacterium]
MIRIMCRCFILTFLGLTLSTTALFAADKPVSVSGMSIGVIARYDDHGTGIPLDVALKMGVKAIQLKAPYPDKRTDRDVQIILDKVKKAGVRITSVQSGFTDESYKSIDIVRKTVGLVPAATREERMEQFRGVCVFAKKLGLDTVCFHFGFVPHDTKSKQYKDVVDTMRFCCDFATGQGLQINLETGQETGPALLQFITDVNRTNLFINFDPANMILYGCGEPIEALKLVGKYVRSVHCKDACWASKRGTDWGKEVPFGQGNVNARLFIQTLKDIG